DRRSAPPPGRRNPGRSARRATSRSPFPAPPRGGRRGAAAQSRLEGGERLRRRLRDGEQRVQLGQLEQGLEILIQAGESQVAALLANLLRERDEDAQARGIDVAGAGEVDDELLGPAVQRLEHLLLQLLAVADDQ